MGKTRRMLGWARCPRPDCEGWLAINDDHEIEDADCECGEGDYTDAEMDEILNNIQTPDYGSVWGDLRRDAR